MPPDGAGRTKPRFPGEAACRNVPNGSQRKHYDFATRSGKGHLWWYLACFSDGGCCAGPQRSCTAAEKMHGLPCSHPCLEGWPSFMIDHTAVRNRMMQWATFRYDMHGELLWESAAGFSNCNASGPTCRGNGTDGWDQQLLAGGNGEGTLFYPGRPDVIGGEGHIPVSSLRLTMIREGSEDYEYLKLAAAKVGRAKVLAVMAQVMRSATEYTDSAKDIMATRKALAKLIAGQALKTDDVGVAPSLSIAVAENASQAETWSAHSLGHHLGAPVRTAHTRDDVAAPVIAVGYQAAVWAGLPPDRLESLGNDEYLVTNSASKGLSHGYLAVASSPHSQRGTMNGIFALLRELGFEFFAAESSRVPAIPPQMPPVDLHFSPPMFLRDIESSWETRSSNLSAALGLDGGSAFAPVGGREGPLGDQPPGEVGTAYNLLCPTFDSDSPTCAGASSPPEPHGK